MVARMDSNRRPLLCQPTIARQDNNLERREERLSAYLPAKTGTNRRYGSGCAYERVRSKAPQILSSALSEKVGCNTNFSG